MLGVSSAANKQRTAAVIGHELAHMWFGNLVIDCILQIKEK